jgi:hypothetical protein
MEIGHEGVRYVLTHFLELGTVCATDDVKSTRKINLAYIMKILQITAATQNSNYEQCLQYHPDIAILLPEAKSWAEGTKIKPKVILDNLNKADALLWVDADCVVDMPEFPIDLDFDVGVFDNIVTKHKNKISAAFILFRNNQKARQFLQRWKYNCRLHKKDHPALTHTIEQTQHRINIVNLSHLLKNCCIVNAYLPERYIIEG